MKFNKYLILLCFISLFSGCDDLREELSTLYKSNCQESETIPFESLGADSTCNGVPLAFAVLESEREGLKGKKVEVIKYLFSSMKIDLLKIHPEDGSSLFDYAIFANDYDVARFLLDKKSEIVKVRNSKGHALEKIALHGKQEGRDVHKRVIKILKGSGIDLNARNELDQNSMSIAYENANPLIWDLFIEDISSEYLIEKFYEGFKPELLFHPVIEEVVTFFKFVQAELDRNYTFKGVRNYRLIHFAAEKNLLKLMRFLIDSRVDLNSKTFGENLWSPIEFAVANASVESMDLLLDEGVSLQNSNVLNLAIKSNDYYLFTKLRDNGALIGNYKDLLFFDKKNNDFYRLLYEYNYGASYSAKSQLESMVDKLYQGQMPNLDVLANDYLKAILKYRLSQTYKIPSRENFLKQLAIRVLKIWDRVESENNYNKLGQSTLSFALAMDNGEKGQLLTINQILSLNSLRTQWGQVDELGLIPLHYSLTSKKLPNEKQFKNYIKLTPNINHVNSMDETVLSLICRKGNYPLAKQLLKKKLFSGRKFDLQRLINYPNIFGETPLMLAKKSGNTKLISYLKSKGATE